MFLQNFNIASGRNNVLHMQFVFIILKISMFLLPGQRLLCSQFVCLSLTQVIISYIYFFIFPHLDIHKAWK